MLETTWKDLRYSARILLKHSGIALVALLATALGIAAVTTVFSTVHALILRPFNFANQDRLVAVWEQNRQAGYLRGQVAPANFADWRDQNSVCEHLVAIEQNYFDLTDGDQPERFFGYRVSAGFFDSLGVNAAHGRTFLPEENELGHERVVVLKHSFWLHRFAADTGIVGQTLKLNGRTFTVVGIMPPDFDYPFHRGQLWTPLVFDREMQNNRTGHYLEVFGLLRPGVTVPQAQGDLEEISLRAQQEFPQTNTARSAYVLSLTDDAVRGVAVAMPALIGAGVFVLLIACANVANLLLARAAARRKEIAVRLALGAGRWRLIRQLLTESVLLALLGGALGLLLSLWGIAALSHSIPEDFAEYIPGWTHFGMNGTVFAFTVVASVLTGLLFGLAPAWQASRVSLNDTLKDSGTGTSSGRRRGGVRGTLVVTEVALSLVLLISAGLLIRSFAARLRDDLGVRPENVLALQVGLPRDDYKDLGRCREFYAQLLRRVESLPGVLDVGAANMVPISGAGDDSGYFQIVGQDPFPKERAPLVQRRVATPGYFKAIGTALRKGRLFSEQDDARSAPVVLVSEIFAKRFFPDREPLGERVTLDGSKEPNEIIGVVADVKNDDVDEQPNPTLYLPYAQHSWQTMNLIVHTSGDPALMAPAVRSQVNALDRNVPVSQVKTLRRMIDERVSPKLVMTWVLAIFAFVALLLAAMGIYAVMSYSVAQRTHEIGIQLALGAQSRDILRVVVGHGLKLTLIGAALGLAGSFAMTPALSAFLYRVPPADPLTFTAVSAVLAVVALVACWRPALRAAKVDPIQALRHE